MHKTFRMISQLHGLMKTIFLALCVTTATACAQLGGSRQLIVSVAPSWDSPSGTMMLCEKSHGKWEFVGSAWNVMYGDSGLAWGIGLHPKPTGSRIKQEGDRRAPAGVFELGEFLGYAAAAPAGVSYPYAQSTSTVRWVDDPQSEFYNKMVDEKKTPRVVNGKAQWNSAERMKINGPDYKYVLFVKHNAAGIPGKGSAIFIHLNSVKKTPTAGCTAMDEEPMLRLLHWIDAKQQPLLVQLPRTEYAVMQKPWGLPPLPAHE